MHALHPPFRLLLKAAALLLCSAQLFAPRPVRADEATTYELTIQHFNEARVFTRTIENAPMRADYAPQFTLGNAGPMVAKSAHVSRWPGWLTLGTGVVTVGVGAVLAVRAAQEGLALQQAVTANPLQYAAPTTQQQVMDKAAALQTQVNVGLSVAVAGVAVAGVGTWLLLREPSRRAVVLPTGQGAQLTVAF